jgi:dTMP kinase
VSGRFIVVEGLDGVGKTTFSKRLAARLGAVWLTTPPVELRAVREPFDQLFSEDIECRQLFYAASVLYMGRVAAKLRAEGRSVVMDRYWSSTAAYSQDSGLALCEVVGMLPAADLTIVLELEEEERQRRIKLRGMSMLDARVVGQVAIWDGWA